MTAPTPRILVVYYSRTGTTRALAEAIAKATSGDLEELRETRSRRGIFGWLRSGYEGTYRLASDPLPVLHELAHYDLVFIGSPTWNRALSSPVHGFIERDRGSLPDVALFATCQGQGADLALDQMTELLPQPPLARLALLERDVQVGAAVRVGEFVESALKSWEAHHPERARGGTGAQCCASG